MGKHSENGRSKNVWFGVIIAAFLLPLFVLGVWSLVDRDPSGSESEKREFESPPPLSLETWTGGEWQTSFDKYYSDTFPARESLLQSNRALNKLYFFSPGGSSGDEDGVILVIPGIDHSQDTGEGITAEPSPSPTAAPSAEPSADLSAEPSPSPSPSPSPTPTPTPLPDLIDAELDVKTSRGIIIAGGRAMEIYSNSPSITAKYAEAVNLYAETFPDSRVINIVVPNSGGFYAPSEYRTGSLDQQAAIAGMQENLSESVIAINGYDALRPHTDEYIYFRSDHHWTQLGAYYAYRAVMEAIGETPCELDELEAGEVEGDFLGTLYNWSSSYPQSSVIQQNPDKVQFWRPMRDFSTRIYTDLSMNEATAYDGYVISSTIKGVGNKYMAFMSGDQPLIKVSTDVGNGKTVLVLKESYGNAFVPWLINHYETVYVVDPRYFNSEGKPSGDLAAFAAEHPIDDFIIIDNPFPMANAAYIAQLRDLIE